MSDSSLVRGQNEYAVTGTDTANLLRSHEDKLLLQAIMTGDGHEGDLVRVFAYNARLVFFLEHGRKKNDCFLFFEMAKNIEILEPLGGALWKLFSHM
ncbi:hypothetical protein ACJX0J_032358, partial [Zea mays]